MRQPRSKRKRSGRRGLVLVLTLFFMMILGLLSVALFAVVPQDLRQSRAYQNDLDAHYAATAGIKEATAFMATAMNPGVKDVSGYPFANFWSKPNDPFGVPAAGYDFTNDTTSDAYQTPTDATWNMSPASGSASSDPNPPSSSTPDLTYYYNNMPCLRLRAGVIKLNNNWCVDVAIYPDKFTWPHGNVINNGVTPKAPAYTVVALAFQDFNGNGVMDTSIGEHYSLRAKANLAVASFARYSYFEQNQNTNSAISIQNQGSGTNSPVYNGPYYTGGFPIIDIKGGASYWAQQPSGSNTYTPAFTGSLTYSGNGSSNFATIGTPAVTLNADGIGWVGGNMNNNLAFGAFQGTSSAQRPYSDTNVPIATDYTRLIQGGQSSIQNVPPITLPPNSTSLAINAWGITEQATMPSQATIVGADKIYVNTQAASPGNAAGGVFVNGDVQQMVLQVLNASGNPIGDGTLSSVVPNNASNGNTAIRVTMSNTYTATIGSGSTSMSASDDTSYSLSASQYSPSYSLSQSNGPSTYNKSLSQSSGPSTYNKSLSQSSGPSTYNKSLSQGSAPSTYNKSLSQQAYTVPTSTPTQTATLGMVNGNSVPITYTMPSNWNYPTSSTVSGPTTVTSNFTVTGPTTVTSNFTVNGPTTVTSNYTVNGPTTVTTNFTISAASYVGMSANTATGTYASQTFASNSNYYTTQKFQPVALVIEANTAPMNLSSSNPSLFSSTATFVFGPAASQTVTQMNLSLSQAAVFNQDHTNPNLFQVATMTMPKGQLNGAVQVQGNIGIGNPATVSATSQGGISGWNKEPRTIAAESDSWMIVSGTASEVSSVGKTLRVDGNINSFGTPLGSQISGSYLYSNNLGLLASNVDLRVDNGNSVYATATNANGSPNTGSGNAMYLYAVVMASGGLSSSNLPALVNSGHTADAANLMLFGGVLQGTPGVILQGSYGWEQNYNYDPENALSPPPFFPTLSDFSVYNYLEERLGSPASFFGGAGGTAL
jgi:hypothetical protein